VGIRSPLWQADNKQTKEKTMEYDPKNYRRDVRKIGKRLFKMAHEWSRELPEKIGERYRIADACKGRKKFATKKEFREIIEGPMVDIARAMRESRCKHRWGKERRRIALASGRLTTLPRGTLKERAERRRKKLILAASVDQCNDYSGETCTVIKYGRPSATTVTTRGEKYSSGCLYSKTDAEHIITVHPQWYSRVYAKGLACLDDLCTLDAELVSEDAGCTIYRATWLRSTLGKEITAQTGYIAIGTHGSVHAKTITGAKSTLTRRANALRQDRHEHKIRALLAKMELNGYANVSVSMADSIAAGNCRPGSEQFRDRYFPGRDTASIQEVLGVGVSRDLAINACLRAIRHAKMK